ncbi:unnamed protein product [Didymodactylos carnosus]|uniref:Nucleolar protein 9 n=1 Tax=Didymodactylos carnosus TaxID=1234261 RepID=A0A8S2MBD4_9BILA|nr:unnamed protein product [Didymodactylos carnosus]
MVKHDHEQHQNQPNKVFNEACNEALAITKSCPRELEEFLPHVSALTCLTTYFEKLSDDFDDLINDKGTCYLLEKLLRRLPSMIDKEKINNSELIERLHIAYDQLFSCICTNFLTYLQQIGSCHIIVATIEFLHMENVEQFDNEYERLIDGGATPLKYYELPTEWNIKDKLRQITNYFFNEEIADLALLLNDPGTAMVFASILRICGFLYEKKYKKLLKQLFKLTRSTFELTDYVLDKNASYVFEIILQFDSIQRNDILYPLILSKTDEFCLHSIGNYFIQKLLMTTTDISIISQLYQNIITEKFHILIEQCHINMLITFIRVCERFNYKYDDLIKHYRKYLNCKKKNHDFVQRVLQSNMKTNNNEDNSDGQHKTTVSQNQSSIFITKNGSLVLQALLRAKIVDSLTKTSLENLTGEQINSIACDPNGSHLLCQLIKKCTLWFNGKEFRQQFYTKLESYYSKMACDKFGSWVIDTLWTNANIEQKIKIADKMSDEFNILRSNQYGKFITYKMNLNAYCLRPEQWKTNLNLIAKKHMLCDEIEDGITNKNRKKFKKNLST